MSTLRRFFYRERIPTVPTDAAIYWSARRRIGHLSNSDERRFQAWLSEPINSTAYEEVEVMAGAVGNFAADQDILRMRAEALAAPASARSYTKYITTAGLAAAAVLATIVAVSLTNPRSHQSTSEKTVASSEVARSDQIPGPVRYDTKTGETRTVALVDGSIVTLNTASILEVDFTAAERDVRLIAGQALFQVAHDTSRPFVVAAGDRRITAVGTAFDVRVYGDRVAVVLVEGHVTVDPLKPTGIARVLPSLSRYGLHPGEELVASTNAPVAVTTADTQQTTSWRRGQLIFRDDTIAAAVAEMNRYSEVQLVVDDPWIANLRISGVFKTSRPENFIAALTNSYPIEAEKRSPLVVALERRN